MAIKNKFIATLNNTDYGHRNLVKNGDFSVWQRGTNSNPTNTVAAYAADCWQVFRGGWQSGIYSYQGGYGNTNSLLVWRTAGDTNTTYALNASQTWETVDVKKWAGKTVTLQFKAAKGGNFSGTALNVAALYGTGTDSSWANGFTNAAYALSAQSITLQTTLQTYYYTFTIPSNATQFGINFSYTPTGTAGLNDWFSLSDVQLELSSFATRFEQLTYAQTLTVCQRYYSKYNGVNYHSTVGSGVYRATITFPVVMRTAPTVTVTGYTGGGGTQIVSEFVTTYGFITGSNNGTGSSTTGWTASADL